MSKKHNLQNINSMKCKHFNTKIIPLLPPNGHSGTLQPAKKETFEIRAQPPTTCCISLACQIKVHALRPSHVLCSLPVDAPTDGGEVTEHHLLTRSNKTS